MFVKKNFKKSFFSFFAIHKQVLLLPANGIAEFFQPAKPTRLSTNRGAFYSSACAVSSKNLFFFHMVIMQVKFAILPFIEFY